VPTPRAFAAEDGQWRLDISVYGEFLASVTGIAPPVDTPTACYQVGTRLEGFIEQRKADGEWTESLPDRHPDVSSLAEIEALALFFRICEANGCRGHDTWA
jgi:hypothetical protein